MSRYALFLSLALLSLAGCSGGGSQSGTSSTSTSTPAATPTFSPAPGSFNSAQSVSLSDTTSGASIYYTTDGSTPTTASTLYAASKPIAVSSTTTIAAIAVASGYSNSAAASGTYTINLPAAATPVFSPGAGTYTSAQSVTLSDSTPGASIYYTTDGSKPTTSSTLYATPIAVSTGMTIQAIAVAPGYASSSVASAAYTINLPAAAAPSFSPAPGSYTAAQTVTLSDSIAGASIYYTTDGTTPTTSSTRYSAPIAVSVTTTINAIAAAPGYTNSSVASGAYTIAGSVSVVLSTHDQSKLMAAQPWVGFTKASGDAGTNTIVVDSTQQYQTVEGFGAAFTDSAAYLLNEVAQKNQLQSAMSDLFTRNGNGIGLSFMRNPVGASDLARSVYSFDDQPVGSTDPSLDKFSIAHDQADILPIIQQAKALNPDMKLLASPWSPPGWMKDPASMSPVSMQGGSLLMNNATEAAFANYLVKYLQAYQAAGVHTDYLTLQNEPLNITSSYPSMGMSASAQLSLLQNYVLPALTQANLSTKVLLYDHNWDTASYSESILSSLTTQQLSQVAGTAWHGYGGTAGAQQTVQNMFPAKGAWMTEHSGGTWVSDQFSSDFLEITHVLRNAGKAYVKWSLALNQNLGPDLTQNAGLGGCNTCTPIVTVNSQTGAITYDIEYYTLGHYSKYVLPGATRIYSSNTPAIASVAFLNPDGSTALVAYNNSSISQNFQVQWGNQAFAYTLPAHAAATFSWTGTQSGTPATAATAQIQGSSYSAESGVQTENTSDANGEFDLGYITPGAYAVYKNVDFGTAGSISTVNVRTASAGNGGTATFYADSMSGAPIATVSLPVTGGWQNWVTVSGTASNVSGLHDVYVVFQGSTSSISNMNWFQFQ